MASVHSPHASQVGRQRDRVPRAMAIGAMILAER
jgi:hypothetical protein